MPRRTVATIARWIYNEPYAVAANTPVCAANDSMESFFKSQQWGFGRSRRGQLIRYNVLHPTWNIHPVQSFTLDWDWQAVYGPHWAPLQQMQPISVMLAAGSAVEVFPHGTAPASLPAARLQPADRPNGE